MSAMNPDRALVCRPLTIEGWNDEEATALPSVEGWDPGTYWNGWAMPLATEEALAAIGENQRTMANRGDGPSIRVEPYGDGEAWVITPTDDEDRFQMIRPTATTPDGRRLYDLGNLGLCWSWDD
jgi:hypothetical protein